MRGADIHACGIETRLDALDVLIRSEQQASRRVSMRQPEGCATVLLRLAIMWTGTRPHKQRPRDRSVPPLAQGTSATTVARAQRFPKRESRPHHIAARDRPPEGATGSDSGWRTEYRSHSEPVAGHPAGRCGPRIRGKRAGHTASPQGCLPRFPPATSRKTLHDARAPRSTEANAAASHAAPRPD